METADLIDLLYKPNWNPLDIMVLSKDGKTAHHIEDAFTVFISSQTREILPTDMSKEQKLDAQRVVVLELSSD